MDGQHQACGLEAVSVLRKQPEFRLRCAGGSRAAWCPRSKSGTPGRRRNRTRTRAGHHAADVRPPGHLVGRRQRDHEELRDDPNAQDPGRRDAQRDDPERQHPHAHARMEDEIGGDHARNGAAGADQRQPRGRAGKRHAPGRQQCRTRDRRQGT